MLGCDDGSVRVWRDVSSSSSSDALDSQSSHGNSNMGSSHGGNHMTASSQHMMSYHGGTVGATGSAGPNVNSSGSTVNNAVELVSSFSALPDVAEISRGYACMYVLYVTRILQSSHGILRLYYLHILLLAHFITACML